MKVELITHTPYPENLVATAAKLCYSSATVDELQDNLTDADVERFIDMLMELGHESPFEHITFTFAIEGISRSCTHQLVRHRIASYSQKSQRYVNEVGFEYITPPYIRGSSPIVQDEYKKLMEHIDAVYGFIRSELTDKLIASGYDRKAAEKIANEDARYVLPNACETKIIMTMNIRSLFNFFKHRCCNRAQWEIRAVATEMLRLCREVAPHIFNKAGPSCYTTGKCPEGKMSCGEIQQVKHFFDPEYRDT